MTIKRSLLIALILGITTTSVSIAQSTSTARQGLTVGTDMLFYTGSNVGIGKTNPEARLDINVKTADVAANIGRYISFIATRNNQDTGFYINGSEMNNNIAGSRLEFRYGIDDGTNVKILTLSSANVGIGNVGSTFRGRLHVEGKVLIDNNGVFDRVGGNGVRISGANGTLFTFSGENGSAHFRISFGGNTIFFATNNAAKNFIINHPLKSTHYLVHTAIESPKADVYYTGTIQLTNGRATVTLPEYFDGLVDTQDINIQLTPVNTFDAVAIKSSQSGIISENTFQIYSDNPNSTAQVNWEVKAKRNDIPQFKVEPLKEDYIISGFGPYRYLTPKGGQQ